MAQSEHEFVQKLIERRKELKITQQKLADILSLPQSTIARIEAEIVSPRMETVFKIANALSFTIELESKQDAH